MVILGPPAVLIDGKLGVHFRGVKLCVNATAQTGHPS